MLTRRSLGSLLLATGLLAGCAGAASPCADLIWLRLSGITVEINRLSRPEEKH